MEKNCSHIFILMNNCREAYLKITHLKPFGVCLEKVNLHSDDHLAIDTIRNFLNQNQLVIVKNQNLSAPQWVSICYAIGTPTKYIYFTHPDHAEIVLVTAEKKDKQPIGLFGKQELGWHTNGTARENPENGLGIYGLNPGNNSVTSFANCHLAYERLSDVEKNKYQSFKLRFKYKNHRFISSKKSEEDVLVKMGDGHGKGIVKPFYSESPSTKKKAIYWGVNYLESIIGLDESLQEDFIEKMTHFCFSDEFIYHHKWSLGDCIFADQLLTQHKRNAVKGVRLIYRTVFHYR